MMKRKLVIGLIVMLLILYLGGSWYFSGLIIHFSVRSLAEDQAKVRDGSGPAGFGLPEPQEFQVQNGDVTLAGWYFENERDGQCGVMILHGRSATRYSGLYYAPLFWPYGCDLVLYDARYHGQSGGPAGTYGYYEKEDALLVLDWFGERAGLSSDQIGLMGVSYGAATVLQAAALRPDIAFVAADSAYADLQTIISEQAVLQFGQWTLLFRPGALFFAGLRAHFDPAAVSPQLAAEAIQAPVFLIHSLSDDYTNSHHSADIYAHLDPNRSVLHLTDWGSAHAQDILTHFTDYQGYMDDFLGHFVPNMQRQ